MKLIIDASNIFSGGGLTHLKEVISHADPKKHGFDEIIIWASDNTLDRISDKEWLMKKRHTFLNKGYIHRYIWKNYILRPTLNKDSILFIPGTGYIKTKAKVVTMSRNMLPFEWKEIRRYPISFSLLRLLILRFSQLRSFKKADGLIFLSNYAKGKLLKLVKTDKNITIVIPHGLNERFKKHPKKQYSIEEYNENRPLKIIYVSTVALYKHQWHVIDAVSKLRDLVIPVVLYLIGPKTSGIKQLDDKLNELGSKNHFVRYIGTIPHEELHHKYAEADIGVFASSCENMPNILLEKMSAGLPIACSNMGPMPEVLSDAGVYFNPENPLEIADALLRLIISPDLRYNNAIKSYKLAKQYSWERCADETFRFLTNIK